MQASIESAFGEGLEIAMTDEKRECQLLVSREELGSYRRHSHDFGRREFGLGIVVMVQGLEQFVKEAVQGYNLMCNFFIL